MAFAFPGGYNTYVPSFEASGQLVVAFSRNPKDFPLNKWATITPVKKSSGYYLHINAEQAARMVYTDRPREFVWHDGNAAPRGGYSRESFEFKPFETVRYAFPFELGYKAVEQADWKILAYHAAVVAQDAMTVRSIQAVTTVTTSGNHVNVATATALGGGVWSAGTGVNPIILKSLNTAAQTIFKATLGRVKPTDLVLLIDPVIADAMARSQELHDYLRESPFAMGEIRGDRPNYNMMWGLPERIYGFPIVVEDTVRVSNRKGATKATGFGMDGNTAVLLTRKGGLISEAGGPSFSSLHIFSYEEMTVEQKDDPDNRLHRGRVVDDYDIKLVSPASSHLITNVLS